MELTVCNIVMLSVILGIVMVGGSLFMTDITYRLFKFMREIRLESWHFGAVGLAPACVLMIAFMTGNIAVVGCGKEDTVSRVLKVKSVVIAGIPCDCTK